MPTCNESYPYDQNEYTNKKDSEWQYIDRKDYYGKEEFEKKYYGDPVEVSDSLRLNEMHKKIKELKDQIARGDIFLVMLENEKFEFQKTVKKLKKDKKKLTKENKELQIEVDKIRSRFDILDL